MDLRQYARGTNLRLILGGLTIVFVVGSLLIYLIYGAGAAAMGLVCLVIGLAPILLILVALWILDVVVRRSHDR